MKREEFEFLSLFEQGMTIIESGKHIAQIKKGDLLLNLFSYENFFVEIYYSVASLEIERIEILTDLSRIDYYIEEKQKEEKLHLN